MLIRKKRDEKTKLKIDFHTHILPAIDDGARTIARSMRYLTTAKRIGFDTVLATPHFYPHRCNVPEFLKNRETAYAALNKSADIPNIVCGAEVLVCEGMEDMFRLDELCIGNSNTMLIELPFDESNITDRMYETIENMLHEKKFDIVMAHPNRYPDHVVDNLISMGAKLQINISHISLRYERRRIIKWLDCGYVYAVGSDIHNSEKPYEILNRVEHFIEDYTDDINIRSLGLLKSKPNIDNFSFL